MAPAVSQAAAGTFSITPAFQDVKLTATQTQTVFKLTLANHTPFDQSFKLSSADFGSLDETGGVAFLGTPKSELDHPYGLSPWMTLEKDIVFVPSGKSADILVTINNRSSLAPGGHYGAVLATAITDTGETFTGDAGVGVRQILSSLVLLTKEGGGDPKLTLVSQTTDAHSWRLPTHIDQRFQNSGNLHVVPRGVVVVRDPAGRVVERAAMNEDSSVILPQSFRRLTASFIGVATAWLPGRYTITSTYRYDGSDATSTLVSSFWYGGATLLWMVLAGILLLSAGLIYWFAIRQRRRKVL